MIRLGIVGSNFGRTVLLPAFRADSRCEVAALCGRDAERTATAAREAGIPKSFDDWRRLIADESIDAIAIATPPSVQSEIAIAALKAGKAVFAEKPLARDLAGARTIRDQVQAAARPLMIDFEFLELPVWRKAKALLQEGGIGAPRHVVVNWQVENYATRMRLQSWKTSGHEGGGVLGNFVSHCLHYLEDFCGPIAGFTARLSALPGADADAESTVSLAGNFASGIGFDLAMSCASYLGSGHRIEFYGEDGTLMLVNTGNDYMRGFTLLHGRRPAEALSVVSGPDPQGDPKQDGRIAPIARLASRFLDAIANGTTPVPGIREAYRVQYLLDAARRSHNEGRFMDVSRMETAA